MAITQAYCWLTPRDAKGDVSVQDDAFFLPGKDMWDGEPPAMTDPVSQANALVTQFTNQTASNPHFPAKRVIKFTAVNPAMIQYDAGWPALIASGIDQSVGITWINDFCDRLIAVGEDIDRVYLDIEIKGRQWAQVFEGMDGAEREAHAGLLYASSAATDRLPQTHLVNAHVAADYQDNTVTNNPRVAWDQNAHSTMARDLRVLYQDAMEAKFGHAIPMCNYNDLWPSFLAVDQFSAPWKSRGVNQHFLWSAPNLYVDDTVNQQPRYTALNKHPQWNALIDKLNLCLSAIAAGSRVSPWIKTPNVDSTPPELVHAKIRLLAAMGVREILAFNNIADDVQQGQSDVLWLQWMRQTREIDTAPFRPEAIALDADQITIGSVTVPYNSLEPHLLP